LGHFNFPFEGDSIGCPIFLAKSGQEYEVVDYSPDFLSNGKGYEALHFLPEPTMQKTSLLIAEMTHHELLSRGAIKVDTPLRLSVAAALAFPDGSMTASGLRREAARGRLVIERIAGKDFTTLANINRMSHLQNCGFTQNFSF
jgi:hypothetical protein